MSFTTRDKVKTRLGIPSANTTHDDLIDDLVAEVNSGMLALFQLDQCDPKSYTYVYDIDDSTTEAFWLISYPVISVDEVKYGSTTQTLTEFYRRNPIKLGLLSIVNDGAYFPFGRQSVEVTHTAGWATVPPELCRAATILAAHGFNTDGKIGFDSEKIGQYQYTLGAPGGAEGGATSPGGWPGSVGRALALHLRPFATDN